MNSKDYNSKRNNYVKNNNSRAINNVAIKNPYHEKKLHGKYYTSGYKLSENQVISGYFVKEKSYKEIVISRINTCLCGILAFLVIVCLVSYYFVVISEIKLNMLSKETIALNYDNSDLQNKLDNLQSFSNVDMQVSKLNMLQRAKQVIELSAADLPDVTYDKSKQDTTINRYMGY